MERYDQLYRLYEEFDAERLAAHQAFVDLFPPLDSRVALTYWEDASDELEELRGEIRDAFPGTGETYADVAAHATRDQAFAGLDLATKYDRSVNALVLDVDETLRSAGTTDNEIPRETLHLLTEFHEDGIPIVVCTGQTLENVKGFLSQGLGNAVVNSGDVSVVYESGTGVFTPGHGPDTKRLLYEGLDETVRGVFDRLRQRVLSEAPETVARGCHLQGNEFNVTLKPNFETGSDDAVAVIDDALVYLLDLLGVVVAECVEGIQAGERGDDEDVLGAAAGEWTRAFYAARDPEIEAVLDDRGELPAEGAETEGADGTGESGVPDAVAAFLDRVDVAYYEGDAAEVVSRELDKPGGVEAAFEVLGVDDPFALVLGDSKSDLRVMEWVAERDAGIAAAPEHASTVVLEHVRERDDLVFPAGDAGDVLRTVYALDRLVAAE
ncbi:HAD family hydrolase [Halosimplex litoreum]|uniref:HAD family hydrolase n=1 Tax=Halosimplex litoreum TaxID=1198301 RepID=A0A7T3FYD0_9EURY|nr:HAD family hydrolase [Halosimplex litoreum]QPV62951.1 HAD family hydrolase [Halosimplex litoreum]